MSVRFGSLALVAMLPLGACATGFSESDLREYCPPVGIVKDAKAQTFYPGGAPGRSKRDYSHIAVITGAAARCYANTSGQMVADVTVSYAVQAGPLFDGRGQTTVYAAISHGGQDIVRKEAATSNSNPPLQGHATATTVVRGLVVGPKGVEEQGYNIVVGFEALSP